MSCGIKSGSVLKRISWHLKSINKLHWLGASINHGASCTPGGNSSIVIMKTSAPINPYNIDMPECGQVVIPKGGVWFW